MSAAPPLATIAVGVIVERSKAESPWSDYHWRPTAVLAGQPDTPPWTRIAEAADRATFYAGPAEIDLYRTGRPGRRCCGWCCSRPNSSPLTVSTW
jgi:hypothetical protein